MALPEAPQAGPAAGAHEEREDDPWAIEIPDHPARTESEGFRRAKTAAHSILAAARAAGPGLIVMMADGR